MRYLRPIPMRLLPDDMLVWPSDGRGGFLQTRMIRHVRLEWSQAVCGDAHCSADAGRGVVCVDSVNSQGAFEVPAGSRVIVGSSPSMFVKSCKRCVVIRGEVHHW